MQLILIFFSFISLGFADVSTCRVSDLNANDCSFYNDCVENRIQCGKSGYALAYGEYYCNRFAQTFNDFSEQFSSEAHEWREKTAVCLQKEISLTVESLLQNPTNSNRTDCKRLRKSAFSQHATCYTQEKSSICNLSPRDIISIFRHKVIEYKDLFFSRDGRAQIKEVQRICLRQLKQHPLDSRYQWWQNDALNLINSL